jgi:hypothetical protein
VRIQERVSTSTLVQVLLPLHDEVGQAYPARAILRVRQELTELFGNLNAYGRMPVGLPPAPGDWGRTGDDLIVFEVMADRLEPGWWHAYRSELERRFHQPRIVVRAQAVEVL